MSVRYEQAGVNLEAGYEAVSRMKRHVARTMRPEVMTRLDEHETSHSREWDGWGRDEAEVGFRARPT
jgi:phosphoribosylaminoimidazole (AIR) synthetase